MTLNTLEHRDVAQVDRVLEGLVGLMTSLTFAIGQGTQIDRVLIRPELYRRGGICRIVNDCVTDIAVVANYLPFLANVIAIMATETS